MSVVSGKSYLATTHSSSADCPTQFRELFSFTEIQMRAFSVTKNYSGVNLQRSNAQKSF